MTFGAYLVRQVKGLRFSFSWKNRSSLKTVSKGTLILLLGPLLNRIYGLIEDKFSVAGSMIATRLSHLYPPVDLQVY